VYEISSGAFIAPAIGIGDVFFLAARPSTIENGCHCLWGCGLSSFINLLD
jgi:hypothetical protein